MKQDTSGGRYDDRRRHVTIHEDGTHREHQHCGDFGSYAGTDLAISSYCDQVSDDEHGRKR